MIFDLPTDLLCLVAALVMLMAGFLAASAEEGERAAGTKSHTYSRRCHVPARRDSLVRKLATCITVLTATTAVLIAAAAAVAFAMGL
jgi:hypothetical protein